MGAHVVRIDDSTQDPKGSIGTALSGLFVCVFRVSPIAGAAPSRTLVFTPMAANLPLRPWLCLLLIGAGVGGLSARAERPEGTDYAFRQWRSEDGLPGDVLSQVALDSLGYLWASTPGALTRFDGLQMKVFGLGTNALGEPVSASPLAAAEGGALWVGATSGGLRLFKDGKLTADARSAHVGNRSVIALFREEEGILWVGCADGRVFRFGPRGVETFDVPRGLPGPRQIGFARDGAGRVWVASDLSVLSYESGALVPLGPPFGTSEVRIASSTGPGPWVMTAEGLYQLQARGFRPVLSVPALLGAHYVQSMAEDPRGVLWIGTRSQGLLAFEAGNLVGVGEPGDDIASLAVDRQGELWVAGAGSGLGRVKARSERLFNKASGLLVDASSSVCEDRDGNLWFANRDGGIAEVSEGRLHRYGPLPDWGRYSAVSVVPGPDGGVIFTCGSGAYAVRGVDDPAIRRVDAVPQAPIVKVSFVSRTGGVWLALRPGQIGRLLGGSLTVFGAKEGVPPTEVRAMAEDANGRLLLGTAAGELFRMENGRFVVVAVPLGRRVGAFESVACDAVGDLWVGTDAGGILWVRPGSVLACGLGQGLPSSTITEIVPDLAGSLWLGSPRGIARVGIDDLKAVMEGRSARVPAVMMGEEEAGRALACMGQFKPGSWREASGRILFATRRGVVELDPRKEQLVEPAPVVSVEEVRVDDQPVPVREAARLSARFEKLEIRFSALNLAHPERVRLRYRLEGFDRDWIDASRERTAVYPGLPPGRYRFAVEEVSQGEVRPSAGASLDITVVPLWWQTWWFRLGVSLAVVLALLQAARAWSDRRLRLRLERLEREHAIERERTRIAQNIHDDVGASLTRISLLTQTASPEADGTAGTLEEIYETTREITRSLDEIVWAINPHHDTLDSFAGFLSSYAQKYLGVAGVRCRLEVPGNLPSTPLDSQTRHSLFLCCKEALHNVAKHSGASEARVSVGAEGRSVVIEVSDNGRGFSPGAPQAGARPGNGLRNLGARMSALGGSCQVESAEGAGTRVRLTLSLAPGSGYNDGPLS